MARRFIQEPASRAKTRAPDRPMAGKKPRVAGRSDVWRAPNYQRLGARCIFKPQPAIFKNPLGIDARRSSRRFSNRERSLARRGVYLGCSFGPRCRS